MSAISVMPGEESEYHSDSHNDANSGSPADGASPRQLRAQQDRLPLLRAALPQQPEYVELLLTAAARLIQMPSSLCGLFQIVENLERILPLLNGVAPEVGTYSDLIGRWCTLIAGTRASDPLREEKLLTRAFLEKDREGRLSVRPPLQGLYTDHAVWCALWFWSGTLDNETRFETYQLLQAHYLGAWLHLQHTGRKLSRPQRIYESGLLLRTIHQPNQGGELDRLASSVKDRDLLYDKLKWLHVNGSKDLKQGYGAFADLLNEGHNMGHPSVFQWRAPGEAGSGHGKRRRNPNYLYSDHAEFWQFFEPGRGDPEQDWVSVGIEEQQPAPLVAESLVEDGIDPEEFSRPDMAWVDIEELTDSADELGELPPLGSLFAIARARARHLVMDVQRFTTRRSRIRIGTFAQIMGALDKCYKQAQEQKAVTQFKSVRDNADKLLETLQLVAVALVTGTPPEQVRRLPKYHTVSELPSDYRLSYVPKHNLWLRPHVPPDRNVLAERYRQCRIETWPRIVLSDVWSVGKCLPEAVEDKWFKHRFSLYERVFRTHIGSELEKVGVDSRWQRMVAMGDLLPSWFQGMEEGDHLRAAIIFGRDDRLAHTQRYYTAVDRNQLDKYYARVMDDLWYLLGDNGFKPISGLFKRRSPVDIPPSLVGDDRIPRIESVRALIKALHQQLQELPATGDFEQQIAWHNNLTVYTSLGMALVTGFRTVRTPVPDLTAIDASTGLLCLQEKDRRDGAHGRIVWLPERMQTQIAYYQRHLKRLRRHLPGDWPTELRVPATKQRDYSQFGSDEYVLMLDKTFFFIISDNDGRWMPAELTGMALQQRLNAIEADHWPVPNAGRHFLRSYLVHEGCPHTLINAHFGHWGYGEEVWGPYSAFDPQRYRQGIAPYLNSLLETLDYRMVEVEV